MQGIYTYIPETNHVPREHCVSTILMLLFMVLISLVPALTSFYLYVSTFRSMCAVPNMAVFCSSLTSWFPGMLLTYFLKDFEMVPVAPLITGTIIIIVICLFVCLCSCGMYSWPPDYQSRPVHKQTDRTWASAVTKALTYGTVKLVTKYR